MMYRLALSTKFIKAVKRAEKRGLDVSLIEPIVDRLLSGLPLDPIHKDHHLHGKYSDCRECHIKSDWVLVYRIEKNVLTLTLVDTGTHSDLF